MPLFNLGAACYILSMRILAIETSCDETAIAIAEFFGPKSGTSIRVLSNIVSSQVKLHAKFGGVVPNLAKREHQRNLVPILLRALREAGLYSSSGAKRSREVYLKEGPRQARTVREPELLKRFKKYILPLKPPPVDAIAVTYGPGLAPALWVGVNFAKALAYLWEKPLIPVDHMLGHLYSAILQPGYSHPEWNEGSRNEVPKSPEATGIPVEDLGKSQRSFGPTKGGPRDDQEKYEMACIKFPALALLVSGGHTELVLMRGRPVRGIAPNGVGGKFKILGETLDDAAGEAFDKVARILGLGYPGGPEISRLAEKSGVGSRGLEVGLPRPMINSKNYNFSFSGLKTAVLYLTRDLGQKQTKRLRPQITKEFQDAVVEVLVKKTIRAAKEYKAKTVLLGGGVAANKLLREKLGDEIKKQILDTKYLIPDTSLTGDNALMIALAAYFVGNKKALDKVGADANLRLN